MTAASTILTGPSTSDRRARRTPRRRRGFTLIEAAIVTVIIGVGVMGILELLAAGTMANGDATQLTTAMHLAGNVREMMLDLKFMEDPAVPTWGPEAGEALNGDVTVKYDDIDDFDGRTFSPPIDVRRSTLFSYGNWSQTVQVFSVDEDLITANSGKDNAARPLSRVTVRVDYNARPVYETSWLVANAGTD
jgi:prepilin-type N-terminal cleavage/methylation domain-containing protein